MPRVGVRRVRTPAVGIARNSICGRRSMPSVTPLIVAIPDAAGRRFRIVRSDGDGARLYGRRTEERVVRAEEGHGGSPNGNGRDGRSPQEKSSRGSPKSFSKMAALVSGSSTTRAMPDQAIIQVRSCSIPSSRSYSAMGVQFRRRRARRSSSGSSS